LRRITKAALGGVASCALILGATQVAAGSLAGIYKSEKDDLKDPLPLTNDGVFDSAKAMTTITQTDGTTTFEIRVTGIDGAVGQPFGAHLHIGPCENSGGHYQDVIGGPIDAVNEAWVAVVPDADGVALGETTVNFVPDDDKYPLHWPGKMSIVIHQGPLDAPGAKQACFPLPVPQWSDDI
jgi:hypothetical protein